MAKGDKSLLASGDHDRETFIRVFFALYRRQRNGVLSVRFGKRQRSIYVMAGEPVAYRSDLPEDDIGRTLVNAKLVPDKQMKWIREKLSEGEVLEDAIVMSGALSKEALKEHKAHRMKIGIGSPLLWGSGEWTFSPRSQIQPGQIDPKLLATSNSLAALWHAVEQHVSMDAVFPIVTDPKAGAIALDPLGAALFPTLKIDEALVGVPDAIGNGCEVDAIFRQVPDSSGNLVKLLWFLEAAGLIHRQGRLRDSKLEDRIDAACSATPSRSAAERSAQEKPVKPDKKGPKQASSKTKESASPSQPAATKSRSSRKREVPTDDQLRATHQKRMGRNFYAFLGLPPNSPSQAIDRKCKGLARKWRSASHERDLPDDIKATVAELLTSVQLVWRTLTDAKHREEYDRRLQLGRAPKVGDLQKARAAPRPSKGHPVPDEAPDVEIDDEDSLSENHLKAREHMEKGDFNRALPLLKKARLNEPSSPDVLADLGWTTWKIKRDQNGDAEEFLRLALTFEPSHLRALEYLARVRMDLGDQDLARKLLQKLLKVTEDPTWARKALLKLSKGAT